MTTRMTARLLRSNVYGPVKQQLKRPNVRLGSSTSSSRYPSLGLEPKRGIKLGHVFSALALLGISATSYGLYQFYSTFTVYPDSTSHPIRSKLRAAIRSESTGELSRADSFFHQAYDLALDLYTTQHGIDGDDVEALIKLSGIAVRWGGMWENSKEVENAIRVYDTGFQPIATSISNLNTDRGGGGASYEVVKRGAGLALKLGDLWMTLAGAGGGGEAESEAERYYSWAVGELMRLSLTKDQKDKVRREMDKQQGVTGEATSPTSSTEEENGIELPKWIGQVELVAAFERLGDLYSRQGRIELAQPLLQQAIATLYPPPSKKDSTPQPPPPISRRCHAATLMNNLSSSLVTQPSPSSQSIEASSRWARQALNVSNSCKREAEKHRDTTLNPPPLREREEVECELTAVVACYNLGKLAEMSKDTISAEQWFVRSEKLANGLGLRDASLQARESLRRLKHPTTTTTTA